MRAPGELRALALAQAAERLAGYLTFCDMHTDDFAKANAIRNERRILEYMIGDATPGA